MCVSIRACVHVMLACLCVMALVVLFCSRREVMVWLLSVTVSSDDSALFASTHVGACHALTTFMVIASSFGLKANLGKTKFMAVGVDDSLEDRCPLGVCGGEIEHVSEFPYLGSIISTDGHCHSDIKSRISSTSRAMGALRRPVFADSNLSLHVKRIVLLGVRSCPVVVWLWVLGTVENGCGCCLGIL